MEGLEQQLGEPRGRAGWEFFFARWRESGRTLSAFCRERGASYHKARYWKKRLGVTKRQRKVAPPHVPAGPTPFAEVLMSSDDLRTDDKSLTIELPSGARISVGSGADPKALRVALEVLAR